MLKNVNVVNLSRFNTLYLQKYVFWKILTIEVRFYENDKVTAF